MEEDKEESNKGEEPQEQINDNMKPQEEQDQNTNMTSPQEEQEQDTYDTVTSEVHHFSKEELLDRGGKNRQWSNLHCYAFNYSQ